MTGEREFVFTWYRLRFDSEGTFIGTRKLRGLGKLNEALDRLTITVRGEVSDLGGNRFPSARPTTVEATRIVAGA